MQTSMDTVALARGQVLVEAGSRFRRVHFPIAGVVSSVAAMPSGTTVEIATTGREGMAQVIAILGSDVAIARHMVQVEGAACAMGYAEFCRFRRELPSFRRALLAFAQAFLVQLSYSVVCNAVHSVQERAARWLLTCHDRHDSGSFSLTQEFLAEMLGVSRPIVNTVARAFHHAGFIRYTRGTITITDREGLEQASCECYAHIRNAFDERGLQPTIAEWLL